ncbi:MAG: RagB/SusD family nutrient uptake outer membrane protein [Rikenellaceae bacterium]
MKNKIYSLLLSLIFICGSCNNETDLYPLSEGAADKWYSDEVEIEMALMDLYRIIFWSKDDNAFTDDWMYRETMTPITNGTIDSQWGTALTLWSNSYKAIARANTILFSLDKPEIKALINSAKLDAYIAEARFVRGAQYGNMIAHFGDVVYSDKIMSIEDSYSIGRSPKAEVLAKVYEDLDYAAKYLPISYPANSTKRATKAAAYALKARTAIYLNDFPVAAAAAKACIDLKSNSLHSDYSNLFLSGTKNSKEIIFGMPRSIEYKEVLGSWWCLNIGPRNRGAWAAYMPSWDLAASYLCSDGLPIDKSPLYDPCNPFKNRDPRMAKTIVAVGKDEVTRFLDIDYDPNPYSKEVMNYKTGKKIKNNDSRINTQYASYTGLIFCKGVDDSFFQNSNQIEPDYIVIRLADVMLIYAEAMIEQNKIDQTVLDAMNQVRARAYGTTYDNTAAYPAITETNQTKLRSILRFERRAEFALEELRYMDIIRWRIAEKALNQPNYGLLDNADLKAKVVDKGLWFFPGTPSIDENSIPDYSKLSAAGLIKTVTIRSFDKTRQYLWPIPSKEILINKNLEPNNPGY